MILPLSPTQSLAGPSPIIRLSWSFGTPRVWVRLADGTPARLLFDTGAYRSFLVKNAFVRLQKVGGTVEKDGTLTASGITLNGYPLPPISFAHETDTYKGGSVKDFAEGYLGMDVLSKYKLGINLSTNEVRLYPATMLTDGVVRDWFGNVDSTRVYRTKMEDEAHRYCVWVDLGNLTVPMQLDTGSSTTFLNGRYLPYLTGAGPSHSTTTGTFEGTKTFHQFRVDWVGLFGTPLGGPRRIAAWDSDRLLGGVLGRDVTAPLRMLLDFPGGAAYFMDAMGKRSPAPPSHDGLTATVPPGFLIHTNRREVAHLPADATYRVPDGYLEIEHADKSHDLVPPGVALPKNDEGPKALPSGSAMAGYRWRWYPVGGWSEIPK